MTDMMGKDQKRMFDQFLSEVARDGPEGFDGKVVMDTPVLTKRLDNGNEAEIDGNGVVKINRK